MAPHYAELNENNEVIYVAYMDDEIITDENGNEVEELGIQHLHTHHGADRRWVRTSYNANFRGKYAALGDTYRQDLDIFIGPSPFPSWTLNETVGEWEAPIPMPDPYFRYNYLWLEESQEWFSINEYVYQTYANSYTYEDIQECCERFDLVDRELVSVLSNENYNVRFEKIKNFISTHVYYDNFSPSTMKSWNEDYLENLIKKANCDLYAIHQIPDEEEKNRFSKYMEDFTDFYLLEEKDVWLIYKRDKFVEQ